MKEIMQEIVLCGLSRAGFFQKAAFYGGTALRIFYGLDLFSEDLDFSLETADPSFDLTFYFPVLEKEVKAFGLNVTITEKEKTIESNIRSAFLKGNTKGHLLLFYADEQAAGSVARSEAVKIKFEVDVNPPAYATFEHKYRLLPSPYEVNMYDMPSLFSGKEHGKVELKAGIFMTMFFIFPKGLQLTRSISGNDCFSLDSLHQMKNVPCQSLSKCFMTDLTLLILSRQNRM